MDILLIVPAILLPPSIEKKKQYIDLIGLLYQIKTTVYWLTFKKLLLLFLLLTNDGIVSIASKSTPDSISCFILGLCHSLITYK